AAVLVHPGAHVEACRHDVGGRTSVRLEDECGPALLVRPALRPVDPVVGCVDRAERDGAVGEEIDRDRRLPRAGWRDRCQCCIRTRTRPFLAHRALTTTPTSQKPVDSAAIDTAVETSNSPSAVTASARATSLSGPRGTSSQLLRR